MSEGTSEDVSKGVDAEAYKSGFAEMDEIRKLDSQLHKPNKTFYEQDDAEKKLSDLLPKLSERFGVPREKIMSQLKKERHLQGEVDRVTGELVKAQRQWDTVTKTGAKPPEPGISGPAISDQNTLTTKVDEMIELRNAVDTLK